MKKNKHFSCNKSPTVLAQYLCLFDSEQSGYLVPDLKITINISNSEPH